MFQRTAPDLNAWRLKSPLALRSNSGKTFFSFFGTLLSATRPPCRSDSSTRTRPALFGADALCSGETCRRTHPLTPAAHAPPAPVEGVHRVLYSCRAVVQIKEASLSVLECPDGLEINCVKCPFFPRCPFCGTMRHSSTRVLLHFHADYPPFSACIYLVSPSPSFPSPPLPAPEPEPPSLPN